MVYAPERGTGLKVKVLEALAQGIPLVTTSEGVEGLPAMDGVHAGISDDDSGLVEKTIALLQDRERQERQRVAALAMLQTHCGPEAFGDRLEHCYKATLA